LEQRKYRLFFNCSTIEILVARYGGKGFGASIEVLFSLPCFSTLCLDSKAGRFFFKEMHLIEVYGEINLLVDPDRRLDIHYSHEVVFSRCDVEIDF
jgi:hypothetical protein